MLSFHYHSTVTSHFVILHCVGQRLDWRAAKEEAAQRGVHAVLAEKCECQRVEKGAGISSFTLASHSERAVTSIGAGLLKTSSDLCPKQSFVHFSEIHRDSVYGISIVDVGHEILYDHLNTPLHISLSTQRTTYQAMLDILDEVSPDGHAGRIFRSHSISSVCLAVQQWGSHRHNGKPGPRCQFTISLSRKICSAFASGNSCHFRSRWACLAARKELLQYFALPYLRPLAVHHILSTPADYFISP